MFRLYQQHLEFDLDLTGIAGKVGLMITRSLSRPSIVCRSLSVIHHWISFGELVDHGVGPHIMMMLVAVRDDWFCCRQNLEFVLN